MKGSEFLDKMELIDPVYIEAADRQPQKRNRRWIKWSAVAACFCLVIALYLVHQAIRNSEYDTLTNSMHTFCIDNNAIYTVTDFEWKHYCDPNGQIKKIALGEQIGIITESSDPRLIGCKVYHFTEAPDSDLSCIVDTPYGYIFGKFTFFKCCLINEIGSSSDIFLSAYGLPDSLNIIGVRSNDKQHLFVMEDERSIEAFFEILSGKNNIGSIEYNQRLAQIWRQTYGNDDIVFDPETGSCGVRVTAPTEITTSSDSSGNTINQSTSAPGIEIYEKALALWKKDMRTITIITDNDLQLTIEYFPITRIFKGANGYYELSPEEADALNDLLQITN